MTAFNATTTDPVLAASYTAGSKTRPALLDISNIYAGRREHLSVHVVTGRADARRLARDLGATPWNF